MNRPSTGAATAPDGLVGYPSDVVAQYRAAGYWRGRSLIAELADAAGRHAHRTALVSEGLRWRYDELFATARRFATGVLATTTLRPGDAVMFQSGNVSETVIAYLGCLYAGLRPVCTLPQHGRREIEVLAGHIGARGIVTQADFGRGQLPAIARGLLADGVLSAVVALRGAVTGAVDYLDVLAAADPDAPLPDVDPAGIALFQLSGGTTGLPKVAPRLHEEYTYAARAWADALGWDSDTVALYPLPLMHNAGVTAALNPCLLSGATLVLAPSANVDLLLDLIEAEHPDVLPLLPPAVVIRLLDAPRSRSFDFSGIRDFLVGGQKLPALIAERLRDELGIAVRQEFGMAEGMIMVARRGAPEAVRHGSVGTPLSPDDEVRIVRPGTDDEVPDGELGELLARGPYTIRGYYRAAHHDVSAFTPDGFYRSGDLARRLTIAGTTCYAIDGRLKDVINRGVEKIHAEEVEELILHHPAVAGAALVAMSDPIMGEKACAYLVVHAGAEPPTVATLASFLSGQGLARYKLPERVEIVTALPLSNVGKVAKKDLRLDVEHKIALERSDG